VLEVEGRMKKREKRRRVVRGISFAPAALPRIDAAAARSGLSRSAFIAQACERMLALYERPDLRPRRRLDLVPHEPNKLARREERMTRPTIGRGGGERWEQRKKRGAAGSGLPPKANAAIE